MCHKIVRTPRQPKARKTNAVWSNTNETHSKFRATKFNGITYHKENAYAYAYIDYSQPCRIKAGVLAELNLKPVSSGLLRGLGFEPSKTAENLGANPNPQPFMRRVCSDQSNYNVGKLAPLLNTEPEEGETT